MPQKAHALRVAPIFGPRRVAELVRSTAALWGDGDPTPHQACVLLLAIFRKLTATWHTWVSQQFPRAHGTPPLAPARPGDAGCRCSLCISHAGFAATPQAAKLFTGPFKTQKSSFLKEFERFVTNEFRPVALILNNFRVREPEEPDTSLMKRLTAGRSCNRDAKVEDSTSDQCRATNLPNLDSDDAAIDWCRPSSFGRGIFVAWRAENPAMSATL